MTDDGRVIPVEIHGQRYPIRSVARSGVRRPAGDATSTRRCARPPTSTPTGDSLRLAVLAALNIADELFRCRDANRRSATASSPNAPRSSSACSTGC